MNKCGGTVRRWNTIIWFLQFQTLAPGQWEFRLKPYSKNHLRCWVSHEKSSTSISSTLLWCSSLFSLLSNSRISYGYLYTRAVQCLCLIWSVHTSPKVPLKNWRTPIRISDFLPPYPCFGFSMNSASPR